MLKSLRTQKSRLHIAHWGGQGRPVLLVHGLAGSASWWDKVSPRLKSHFEVAALDLLGHGDSAWSEDGNYTTELLASNIEEARKFLNWDKFLLVGHSLGARVSVEYAANYSSVLEGLVAIDFMPDVKESSPRFSKLAGLRQPVFSNEEAMLGRFHLQPRETTLSEKDMRELAKNLIKPWKTGFTWKCDWRAFLIRYDSVWPLLSQIQAPSLMVRGQLSPIMEEDDIRKVCRQTRGSESLEIPNAYHHVPLDAPQSTVEAIVCFTRKLAAL